MIPKYFKTPDLADPADPLYCLVAANGSFLVRKTPLFTSITATESIPGLERQSPSLTLAFGKVPCAVMEQIYGFFQWAWREWESEAITILYYDPGRRRFQVDVPPQKLFRYRWGGRWRTEGRLEYGALERPVNCIKLGDAHSHGQLPAFFSAADDRDDMEDGLRIVMGDLDTRRPSVRVSFVAGNTRFHLDPEEALESFSVPAPPPPEWIRRVSVEYEEEKQYGTQTPSNGRWS